MSPIPKLPDSIRVIVRGWLNCNQILLLSTRENVLVDSGYARHAGDTLALLRQPAHLGKRRLHRLINTHCHSDHMGGNAMLAREYKCRITIPEGEAKHLTPWNPQALWMAYADQYAEKFKWDDTMRAGEIFQGGGLEWRVLAAPGHDMDALMFWNPSERMLISGDALWEDGMGVVLPAAHPNPHIVSALDTLERIAALKPKVVIPGHGTPFADSTGAVERARGRLQAFASDPAKNARHVVKVMLMFALLDKQRLRVDALPKYLDRIPVYRDMNERFIHADNALLAERSQKDLLAAGAVRIEDGWMLPNLAA